MRVHNSRDTSTVAFPHASESWLPANVPNLQNYPSFGHLSHIKSNSRDHVITELSSLANYLLGYAEQR